VRPASPAAALPALPALPPLPVRITPPPPAPPLPEELLQPMVVRLANKASDPDPSASEPQDGFFIVTPFIERAEGSCSGRLAAMGS
jgi:hypothetical protein